MEIKLSKEEVDFITSVLGEIPSKYTYNVLKLLEQKNIEAKKLDEQNICPDEPKQ